MKYIFFLPKRVRLRCRHWASAAWGCFLALVPLELDTRANISAQELHRRTDPPLPAPAPRAVLRATPGPGGKSSPHVFSVMTPPPHSRPSRTSRPCCQPAVPFWSDAPESPGGHVRSFLLSCWPHIKVYIKKSNTYFQTLILLY